VPLGSTSRRHSWSNLGVEACFAFGGNPLRTNSMGAALGPRTCVLWSVMICHAGVEKKA
jgi:hypothetical protein